MGDGRYIQFDQRIHMSVLKRELFDQAFGGGLTEPMAHLAPNAALPATWPTLLTIANAGLNLWEVIP